MRILLRPGLVIPLLLSACGSTDTKVGGESGYSAFLEEFRSLVCEAGANCCNDPTFPYMSCELSIAYINANAGGPYRFNQDAADQCLAAVRADRCFVDIPDICRMAAVGLTEPGGVCQTSFECAPPGNVGSESSVNAPPLSLGGGVCDSPFEELRHCRQAVGLGEACVGTCVASNDCSYAGDGVGGFRFCYASQGVYCGASGTCEALVPSGGSCTGREACATGLICLYDSTCGAPPVVGAGCLMGFECSAGNYCDDAYVCAPQLPLGATCDWDEACQSSYCRYSGSPDAEISNCAPGAFACLFDGLH